MSIEFKVNAIQSSNDNSWAIQILASRGAFIEEDTCNVAFLCENVQEFAETLTPALTTLMRHLEAKKNVN